MADRRFTTADADRLLNLGDQLLDDWREAARLQRFGEVGPDYVARKGEWDRIRPMLVQAPALRALLDEAVVFWGDEFADPDNPVDGGDLVEWFAEWLPRVQDTLGTLMRAEAKAEPERLNVPGGPV